MGWFSKDTTTPTQQFGAPQMNNGMNNGMGMYGGGGGMDSMMQMQQQQNPMMQQMANDPVVAVSRLLELHDPVGSFLVSQNLPMLADLIGEVVRLSLKEFMTQATFTLDSDTGKIVLDSNSLPSSITTLSPENLGLTLNRIQQNAQMSLQQNAQQKQMLLNSHQMTNGMMGQQQPGFFGSLLGSALGNQMQNGNMTKVATGMVL